MRIKDSDEPGPSTPDGVVTHRRERRNASLLSKRIFMAVKDVIAPMAHRPSETTESFTSFTFTETENITVVLRDVLLRDCPGIMNDRSLFMQTVATAYDAALRDRSTL